LNLTQYTYLINKPDIIDDNYSQLLEQILEKYPYFQSARALNLKRLFNNNSSKYNNELKRTAGVTADRTVLFDFITSDNFVAIQKGLYEKKLAELMDITVIDSQIVLTKNPESALEHSIIRTINAVDGNNQTKMLEEKLEIGKPIEFSKDETHSFNEWLQLSRFQPIDRNKKIVHTTILEELNSEKNKKSELIDKFIETNPKIPQIDKNTANAAIAPVITQNIESNLYLMTETLAKVYLEQKKYSKAIQAYQILILKYPEKSSFFANRISDIESLKNNNL
jgi:tetratricopeptide (TPR) repeat protein